MDSNRGVFLTGATGVVGSYLLKILLEKGCKVFCLSRGKKGKTARQRVEDVLNFWDAAVSAKHAGRLIVVEGDIVEENLGLDKRTVDLLNNEVEQIFHSAAVTEFSWALDDIRKVNVGGTKNVLDLALTWQKNGKLERVNHISTAYVCGDYKGVFTENDLDMGQGFNTTYEQSKYEAEKLVNEYRKKELWIDVFRPSMVVGDSRNGKILEFNNIYMLLSTASLGIFDVLPCLGLNVSLTPIDLSVEALYLFSQCSIARNKTYHIFPLNPVSFVKLIEYIAKRTGNKMPDCISLPQMKVDILTPVQRKIFENSFLFLNPQVELDSTYTNRILRQCGGEYLEFNQEPFWEYFRNKGRSYRRSKDK